VDTIGDARSDFTLREIFPTSQIIDVSYAQFISEDFVDVVISIYLGSNPSARTKGRGHGHEKDLDVRPCFLDCSHNPFNVLSAMAK
jgi:hypothetical protein